MGRAQGKYEEGNTQEMGYKPDYGLRRMKDGIGSSIDHIFYDFRLYSLTVLADGEYSTMVDYPFGGEVHALSLDFNRKQLGQILAAAPPEIAQFIRQELSQDPSSARTLDFTGEAVFGVRARLGGIQRNQRESYVPLVAQEIF
jgi:hypothetical protein